MIETGTGQFLDSEHDRYVRALIDLLRSRIIPQRKVQAGEEPFEIWQTGSGESKLHFLISQQESVR